MTDERKEELSKLTREFIDCRRSTPRQNMLELFSSLMRIVELESAIKEHRSQKLDDRCWLDDQKLYAVLKDGEDLAPILLVRDERNGKVIIADGYHRMCAVYHYDEDAIMPCKIV